MTSQRPRLVSLPSFDALFVVEPESFVSTRNDLVKQLKAAGDKIAAAEVAGLRRPPLSAWALNQVARRHPEEVDGLIAAAEELAAAMADPGSSDLRSAQRGFRATIEQAVRTALKVVAASGRTPSAALQQAVQSTLQAAAVDPAVAAALRAGVLAADEPARGFLIGDVTETPQGSSSSKTGRRSQRASEPSQRPRAPARGGHKKAIGGRDKRSASAPDPVAPRATASTTSNATPSITRRDTAERARLAAEERETERRRRERLAELRAESRRLEKRAARLAAAADHADAAAHAARVAADEARDQADATLAALEVAESGI